MRSARAACLPCYGKLETVFAVEFRSARGANLGSHSNSQSILLQIVSTGCSLTFEYRNQDRIKKIESNFEFGPSPAASQTMRRPLPVREKHRLRLVSRTSE